MMKKIIISIMVVFCILIYKNNGIKANPNDLTIHFTSVDIWVNSGEEALAAYQTEIVYDKNKIIVVGIEGGEKNGFKRAPFYDLKGMKSGRIIIASFIKNKQNALNGKARIARLHLQVSGEKYNDFSIKLMAAANVKGEKIQPSVKIIKTDKKQIKQGN